MATTEAPAPTRRRRPNKWVQGVWDAWHCATHAWELEAEAVTLGYATEMAEYEEQHPRPRFKDFLIHLSPGTGESPQYLQEVSP